MYELRGFAYSSIHHTELKCPGQKTPQIWFISVIPRSFLLRPKFSLSWHFSSVFSTSNRFEAFSRKPDPNRSDSRSAYSSEARDLSNLLALQGDTLPSNIRALWINRSTSMDDTLAFLFSKSVQMHVSGPVTSRTCSCKLNKVFSAPKWESLPLHFNCSLTCPSSFRVLRVLKIQHPVIETPQQFHQETEIQDGRGQSH